jgi:hypothetical protein
MKFQDGFKKKLVQTDFQWNSDNALMTLRKKGGVTVTVTATVVTVTVGPCGGVCRFCRRRSRQLTSCMSAPPSSFVPHLPVAVAADIARLTAASAVDPASCAKLVDMRADELISNACAANPKCKELRDAAGVHGMASAAAALPSLM